MKTPFSSKGCWFVIYFLCALSTQTFAEEQTDITSLPPADDAWLDIWHSKFSNSMHYTAQQLDEFFALDGSDNHKDARAEGRVRFGIEPRSRDLMATDFRFRIRVKLPALKNRVDLLLSDDDDYTRQDNIRAARDSVNHLQDSASLALRYQKSENSNLSHRIGAGRGDQLFARSRYEDEIALNEKLQLNYDGEIYYYTRDQFGAELGLNFTRMLADDKFVRMQNRYYFRDRSDDWLWRHEFQYLRPLTDQSALLYTFFIKGLTEPNYHVTEVYTSVRWRTNYRRSWLFFELEPFVIWLKEEHFSPSYGLALRFEFYYGTN
ncbi:hypothetical protein FJ444_09965 [Aestuariibacter sp. GS-14]|uniref:hypothetical protein n=1 Tax=Alteromonadaceae TaxID=72275 RepID=UPI00112DBA7D|nr:hypothetical protein [Aestuariibacter sp. GS-14]TPV58358.1 hypothetical protein FJ444_09965 [Aestuariibacter sp. GS-14]